MWTEFLLRILHVHETSNCYFYVHTYIFVVYYLLFVLTNAYICITTLNYITNTPTYFGASAPSSGRFDIVFAEVIKY